MSAVHALPTAQLIQEGSSPMGTLSNPTGMQRIRTRRQLNTRCSTRDTVQAARQKLGMSALTKTACNAGSAGAAGRTCNRGHDMQHTAMPAVHGKSNRRKACNTACCLARCAQPYSNRVQWGRWNGAAWRGSHVYYRHRMTTGNCHFTATSKLNIPHSGSIPHCRCCWAAERGTWKRDGCPPRK
jgi:hypothetical protein